MCCIIGKIGDVDTDLFKASAMTMSRRGPDGFDFIFEKSLGVSFGHGRLAIRDLSSNGNQPMESVCKRYLIVFNGEIYNTSELKSKLPGVHWRGTSDTEILLGLISKFGFREAIVQSVGMFAIAVWDRQEKTIKMARDRYGEKPFYYSTHLGGGLFFASELKAFVNYFGQLEVDKNSISDVLRYGCVTGEGSIYKKIKKLPPAHMLTYHIDSGALQNERYWSIPKYSEKESRDFNFDSELENLENTICEAISGQLLSDVPLGAFLSGGIDSSLIVAIAAQKLNKRIQTFTVGFEGNAHYSEVGAASAVARHLGVSNEVLEARPDDLLELVQYLPVAYCEPFADSSQLPTMLVSKMAKQRVTVALSGDGGDEIFWGYNRYFFFQKYQKHFFNWPISKLAGRGFVHTYKSALAKPLDFLLKARVSGLGEKMDKIEKVLKVNGIDEYYASLTTFWMDELGISEARLKEVKELADLNIADLAWYLPDDILAKVDRAAMWSSLETRAPFLDHRVVEAASRIPIEMHVNSSGAKLIEKKLLYKYVPQELMDRPKQGFGVPIEDLLRGPLKNWAEDLFQDDWFWNLDIISRDVFVQKWSLLLRGQKGLQHEVWSVLMLMQWARYWKFPPVG